MCGSGVEVVDLEGRGEQSVFGWEKLGEKG